MSNATDPAAPPHVAAVVVHFGNAEDTGACLASLERLAYPALDLIVVDNGSSEYALDGLRARFPGAEFLRLPENVGYAAGANRGLDRARARGAQFAWLLNNDIAVSEPGTLSALLARARETGAAICSPRVLNQRSAGHHVASDVEYFFPRLALTFHSDAWPAGLLRRVTRTRRYLSGAAMFIDLAAAPMPFFDEIFFAYFEDLDVCLRVGEERLAICPAASVLHKVSRSTGGNLRKHSLKARSLIVLARKHRLLGPGFLLAYWLLFIPIEARKYWRSPLAFMRATREAYRAGRTAPLPR